MKITKKQLRKLIAEALDEGSRIIVDPEGEATVASDAYQTGTAKDAQTTHPKLMNLRQSGLAGQRQARQLAVDLDMQPELTTGEEVAVEMGKQKAMAPDIKFHNELSGDKSIEFSQYLKRECEKRGFTCTVKDERDFDPEDPFIAVHVVGKHPLRGNDIDVSIHLSDSWMGTTEIEIYAKGQLDPDVTIPASKTILFGLEQLSQLVIDAASEIVLDNPLHIQQTFGELAERKKRKKKKKKKTKSKKKGYLYPYVYGYHDHDFYDYGYDIGDSGFDGGGDGGGGE